jgi:glycyl-tRNA synthetase beta chain
MKELFFELGLEELPARLIRGALKQLQSSFVQSLNSANLEVGEVKTYATPRRLALSLTVAEGQADVTEEVTGPPARIAFDEAGRPTKAGLAFAHRHGITEDALTTKETPKGAYLAATVFTKGQRTIDLAPAMLVGAINAMKWPKAMTWGRDEGPFIRPIHWMVALYDGQPMALELMGVKASNKSRGHRFMAPDEFTVTECEQWCAALRAAYVEPDPALRSRWIEDGAEALASSVDGELVMDAGLLEELTFLSEWPVPLLGTFAAEFLTIPSSALITSMRVHQKYAAINDADGTLTNKFIIVAGLPSSAPDTVVTGNERVLAARLADARFFFEADTKVELETFVAALDGRIYLKGLGTMADKAKRLGVLSGRLAQALGADLDEVSQAERAGFLAKADLSSQMVGEFASLQGQMGKRYAELHGEEVAISSALEEHYWPKHATDTLPAARVSVAVALADRLDALVGCFSLGLEPTGSADPFALRRGALGVIRILAAPTKFESCGLSAALDLAHAAYGDVLKSDWSEVKSRLLSFFRGRLKNRYAKRYPTDLTEAVLASHFDDPADVEGRLHALSALKTQAGWDDLAIAVKRVVRIAQGQERYELDATTLAGDAELALYEAFSSSRVGIEKAIGEGAYTDALRGLIGLKPHIDRFFDDVMVMSEDMGERTRRLALLGEVADLFGAMASFDKVST